MGVQAFKQQHTGGFTLIELVIVITLIGLLAAAAIPRLLSATDHAEVAALEGVAGGFSIAVSIGHAQWAADGHTAGGPTDAANKTAINLDGKIFYMNEYGWPANTQASESAAANDQQAVECQQVFADILQTTPSSTTDPAARANHRYFISVQNNAGGNRANRGDVCRFELILDNAATAQATHYFDYDLVDGQITLVYPS